MTNSLIIFFAVCTIGVSASVTTPLSGRESIGSDDNAVGARTTWLEQEAGTGVDLNGVDFIDDSTGWVVGTAGTILHTTNGGRTWERQTSGTSVPLEDICFVDGRTGWAVGWGRIVHTEDGGATWVDQPIDTRKTLFGVSFVDRFTGWAVGDRGHILHTTNGGRSWKAQVSGRGERLRDVSFRDESNGSIAVSYGGTIRTTNGGTTWFGAGGWSTRGICFADDLNGWAVGVDRGIYRTTNGGGGWTFQTSGSWTDLYDVSFVDANTGWAVGDQRSILHTSDGGTTWETQSMGTNPFDDLYGVCFVDGRNGWAVGRSGRILHTITGGTGNEVSSPPTLLSPSDNGAVPADPFLQWDHSPNALSYTLQVSESPYFVLPEISAVNITEPGCQTDGLQSGTLYYWRVSMTSKMGTTTWSEARCFTPGSGLSQLAALEQQVPSTFSLHQNYPNPFNPTTVIRYELPLQTHVLLELFNMVGQRVAILVDEEQTPGYHARTLEAGDLSSGTYLYRLHAGDFVETRKLLLIR